jgi:hypothetical protein
MRWLRRVKDLINREKLLAILSEQAPLCREPQVRMMGNGCNCWRGITNAMDIVTAMPTEKGNDAT